MTVVAYKDKVMAADSRVSRMKSGELVSDNCRKIVRMPDGALFGWAGDYRKAMLVTDILKKEAKKKKPLLFTEQIKGVEFLLVDPTGKIFTYEFGYWVPHHMDVPYVAIGSGYELAHAAMDAGASAEEAVKITIKRSIFCGGKCRTLELS